MSPELRNLKSDSYNKFPRAAVALTALTVFAVGCSGGEVDPKPSASASSVESHDAATHTPEHSQTSASPKQDGQPHSDGATTPHQEQSSSAPNKPSKVPAATPSPEALALIFKVTGSCHMDGELENWSKNFTPYGSTHNEIIQPDGTMYEGPINDTVDGLGHSQWGVVCSDFAQEGDYKGIITDLGPDNAYGTADDRTVPYTFGISNS